MKNNGRFIAGRHYSPKTEFKKGQHWRSPKKFWDAQWLRNEYAVKKRSAKEIAKENGCIENNIFYWLDKHGIKRRTISEARIVKHWGVSGPDNPMWNKRGELSPNWKGGRTPERQAFYSSIEWRHVCLAVWRRDKGTCQRCKIKANEGVPFHIHHIISFAIREKRAELNNLILLCEICHHWIHSRKNIKREFLG